MMSVGSGKRERVEKAYLKHVESQRPFKVCSLESVYQKRVENRQDHGMLAQPTLETSISSLTETT